MTFESLQGKLCLVTGGSRTLGAQISRYMAHIGAQVAINYHQSQATALKLRDELLDSGYKAHVIQANVTKTSDVARLVEQTIAEFGRIDILVNNVGPYVDTPF